MIVKLGGSLIQMLLPYHWAFPEIEIVPPVEDIHFQKLYPLEFHQDFHHPLELKNTVSVVWASECLSYYRLFIFVNYLNDIKRYIHMMVSRF